MADDTGGIVVDPLPNATASVVATPAQSDAATIVPDELPSHPTSGATGNFVTDANRIGDTLGANVFGGLAAMPHAITSGIDAASRYLPFGQTHTDPWLSSITQKDIPGMAMARSVFGNPPAPDRPVFPSYDQAREAAFAAEGGQNSDNKNGPATEYIPSTYGGKLGMAGGTAALTAALDPPAIIPSFVGGMGGQIGADVMPNHPFISSMLGFLTGAGVGGLGQKVAATGVDAAATKVGLPSVVGKNDTYQAFTNLGLPTDLTGTTTKTGTGETLENVAGKGNLAEKRADLLGAWQNKVGDVADTLSPNKVSTPQELGMSLQNEANAWHSNFTNQASNLYNRAFTLLPPDTQINVSGYQKALKDALGKPADAQASSAVMTPNTVQKLSDALGVDLTNGQMKANQAAAPLPANLQMPGQTTAMPAAPTSAVNLPPAPQTLSVEGIRNLRTKIGEALTDPKNLVPDTNEATLRSLYRGLSADLENGAGAVSPQAQQAFRDANDYYRNGMQTIQNVVQPILKGAPEQAAGWVMQTARNGSSRLNDVVTAMPNARGDIAGYTLRTMGGNGANPSPSFMYNAVNGRARPMYSPETQQILFGGNQAVNDLQTTANAMKGIEKTGSVASHGEKGIGLIGLAEAARLGAEAMPHHPVLGGLGGAGLALGATVGGRVGANVLNNPAVSGVLGRNIRAPAGYAPLRALPNMEYEADNSTQ